MAIHPDYREKSFDCLLHSLMQRKRKLAKSALWPMGDTETDSAGLQQEVGSAKAYEFDSRVESDILNSSLKAMFLRDGESEVRLNIDGSIVVH